jgi:hypothetical protein
MSIIDRPLTNQESTFLVRWLRTNRDVPLYEYDQKFFLKQKISYIINELKNNRITVTEKEVLTATRRIMPG